MFETLSEQVIVALDVSTLPELQKLVSDLSPHVSCFKIGLEALTAIGAPDLVSTIHGAGGKVFLDGKFCDIPNTIAKASRVTAALGVAMFNVHASCGVEAMRQAAAEKGSSLLLAVTVLTSISDDVSKHIFGHAAAETTLRFAADAKEAGADGVICSPQELEILNQDPQFKDFYKVTPGVRPLWASRGDQKRVLTPVQAIQKGASALVVGRPITNPPSEVGGPVQATKRILEEISQ